MVGSTVRQIFMAFVIREEDPADHYHALVITSHI